MKLIFYFSYFDKKVLDATKKAIDNNANTIDRNRKEMDSKIEALKTELNSNKQVNFSFFVLLEGGQ